MGHRIEKPSKVAKFGYDQSAFKGNGYPIPVSIA